MVSQKGDIPDRDEVTPDAGTKIGLLTELLDRGETIVHLQDGSARELHGYDTHLFRDADRGVVYTQNEDDDEIWFFASEIVSLEQH